MVDGITKVESQTVERDHTVRQEAKDVWLDLFFYNISIMRTNSGVPQEFLIQFKGSASDDLRSSH